MRSPNKRWRSISLNCAIRGKERATGGGPRELPLTSHSLESTYSRGISWNCSKLLSVCNKGSRFGNRKTLLQGILFFPATLQDDANRSETPK